MIISHKHRYLFIEVPLTGSYAIRHELCTHYDGSPILHKHASYVELQRVLPAVRDYFVFATVRNPLDEVVSRYFKYKTDHKQTFSDPESMRDMRADFRDVKKYEFIRTTNATFADYFARYHQRPFVGTIDVSHGHIDFVIRFERLQEGFSSALERLQIDQVGPIPVANKTQGRESDWRIYYTPDVIDQAKRNFGPFMKRWGYEFPSDWGEYVPSGTKDIEFRLLDAVQRIYLTRLRYNQAGYATAARRVRAWLSR